MSIKRGHYHIFIMPKIIPVFVVLAICNIVVTEYDSNGNRRMPRPWQCESLTNTRIWKASHVTTTGYFFISANKQLACFQTLFWQSIPAKLICVLMVCRSTLPDCSLTHHHDKNRFAQTFIPVLKQTFNLVSSECLMHRHIATAWAKSRGLRKCSNHKCLAKYFQNKHFHNISLTITFYETDE